jgi:hypothetical protein
MLKELYRSWKIARTAAAASEEIRNMSSRQLADIGISEHSHVPELIAGMQNDYAAADAAAKAVGDSTVSLSIKLQSA